MKSWGSHWKSVFRLFGLRGWLVAIAGAAVTLVMIGIPTAIINNPFFLRQLPATLKDYVIWISTGILAGLLAGTFTLSKKKASGGRVASGGFLSFLAVSCPICNKIIVLLLGVSGALTFFAPLQIYIGAASVALLVWALHLRVEAIHGSCCAVPQQVETPK